MTDMVDRTERMIAFTTDIVSAHVSNNSIAVVDVPDLIQTVHGAILSLAAASRPAPSARGEPAVPVDRSIGSDHIVCLEDGRKLKMLKRYLATRYGMTPSQYRQKWGLPLDYPMVAPAYAETRRSLAKKIGLGTRPRAQ